MRVFKIPTLQTSTNKSVRFPDEVIERVEKAIMGTDCSFSAFVIEAVIVALECVEEQSGEQSDYKS